MYTNDCNVIPMGHRVVAKELKETTTASGIILTAKPDESTRRCEVLAVAESVTEVQIGDVIVIGMFAGSKVLDQGIDYVVVKVEDVIAKIN